MEPGKHVCLPYVSASLFMGPAIGFCYAERIPDFDIGFSETFIAFECWMLIVVLWGVETGVLRMLRACIEKPRRFRQAAFGLTIGYVLIVWGCCHYLCVVGALLDWNRWMGGDVG